MKYQLVLLLLLVFPIVNAQTEHKQEVKTSIKDVTVFITGGEIIREKTISLKKGRNILIYTGISTVADQKSIQFSSDNRVSIVSVSTEYDYLKFSKKNPRIKKLNDSLKYHAKNKRNLDDELGAYQSELQLLKNNMNIKGNNQNLTAIELKEMADFHRKRVMELNKILSSYKNQLKELRPKITAFNNQLSELNYNEKTHSNQIIVVVDVNQSMRVPTQIKYIISNCGWQANYDLSAKDVAGKIKLKYKAKVFNNTGNNWDNVKLTLSTSNPNLSATAPVLDSWFLNNRTVSKKSFSRSKNLIVPKNRAYSQYHQNSSIPQISQNLSGVAGSKFKLQNGQNTPVKFTTIEVPQISTEFLISKPYSIPSNSKPYLVEIENFELPATFSHKAVPKLDKDAFLIANIVGWEKLNLISGPTHIYYQGNYVGESYLNTRNVSDTLSLSFGRDNKVLVEKKLVEEFSSTKTVGLNKKDKYTYEITVKNNMNINLSMDLFDQVPISQDGDISVDVDDVSDAKLNEETGILIWAVNLKPEEQKKYRITFTIKYPKNKTIAVKKYRAISAPTF